MWGTGFITQNKPVGTFTPACCRFPCSVQKNYTYAGHSRKRAATTVDGRTYPWLQQRVTTVDDRSCPWVVSSHLQRRAGTSPWPQHADASRIRSCSHVAAVSEVPTKEFSARAGRESHHPSFHLASSQAGSGWPACAAGWHAKEFSQQRWFARRLPRRWPAQDTTTTHEPPCSATGEARGEASRRQAALHGRVLRNRRCDRGVRNETTSRT